MIGHLSRPLSAGIEVDSQQSQWFHWTDPGQAKESVPLFDKEAKYLIIEE
jgi:hypothetical protein